MSWFRLRFQVSASHSDAAEALLETLDAVSITLTDGGGNTIPSTVVASSSGDTFSVTLDAQPELDATVTATVSGLTDAVGNPVEMDEAWTFEIPAYLSIPSPTATTS